MVVVDQKVRNKSRKMSREQSEEEDVVVGTEVGLASDGNGETEVKFRPPRGTNRMPEERPIITGVDGAETDERDPGQTNRFGPKSKWPKFELPIQRTPGPCRTPPGTGKQPEVSGTDRFLFEMPTPTYTGLSRQPPEQGR